MAFCLPREFATKFINSIRDGSLDPVKMSQMTSEERRTLLGKVVGEADAREVNAMYESKLLLKDQQRGLVTWIKKVGNLTPDVKRDLIARVERMDKILTASDEKAFLEDLAAKKLGAEVTFEEAQKIYELSQNIGKTQDAMRAGGDRLEYGRARVALGNYVSDLVNKAQEKTLLEQAKDPVGMASELAGTAKGLKASLDDSAIFRQGWKTVFTHSTDWLRNSILSFQDIARSLGGKAVKDEVQADIQSRAAFEQMKKGKLDIGTTEEAFPTHLAEKIPVIGKLYKASEAAYTGFVYRMRADLFEKYLKIAETAGVDITSTAELESIGKLVNALTGRGYLGEVGEKAASVTNNIFFSPRFLKSNFDFLTAHQMQKGVTPFVRKQAALNLVKVIAGTATILAIANALMPGSVETDPRSSNFGKIKVGNQVFDMSGGMSSLLVLAMRLVTLSTKSASTGKVTPLNAGTFGAQTGTDVLYSFAEGKLSPAAGIVRDLLKGQDFNYNKPTVLGEAENLLVPLPITNAVDLYQHGEGANPLIGTIADAFGISTNIIKSPKQKAK